MTNLELEKAAEEYANQEWGGPKCRDAYIAGASKGVELFIRDRLPELLEKARDLDWSLIDPHYYRDVIKDFLEEAKK